MNKKNTKNVFLAASLSCSLIAPTAQAANWLMLQGTEPAGAAERAKLWGFIQAQYQHDNSEANASGGFIPPKLIGPNLDNQDQFNINRARIGVRGVGLPLDSNVNYFFLAEFGNNGITAPGDRNTRITDASITLNHIDGARIRMGLFKTPGPEEALQAIHVFDYINFTTMTNQMMLERFPQSTDTNSTPQSTPNANMGQYSTSVGAFRDVGVQVFDTFKSGSWEHSYAIMIGNGNGLNFGNNDNNKDLYLYWSSEDVYGGKGGRREGLKLFAWRHDGTRVDAYDTTQEQDRTRTGIGVKYLKKPYRASAEIMKGEGMIFMGQHRPQHIFNNEEADGAYIEGGWYIPNTRWEVDLRYDTYTRGEAHPSSAANDESSFDTITLGGQYHINRKTRINMEYSSRDFESDTTAIHNNVKDVDKRYAVQVTHIF